MTALPNTAIQAPRPVGGVYRVGTLGRFYEAVLWRRRVATEQAFVRKVFRDGDALYAAYQKAQPIQRAVLRDGRALVHPDRVGLIATLIELWHHRGYTQGLYRPRPGDTVIDAGANVGVFSAYLLRDCPGVRVLAIEPALENIEYLRKNLTTFGGSEQDIIAAALGPEAGEAEFLIAHRSLDHRVISAEASAAASTGGAALNGNIVRVPVQTLDQIMEQAGVDRVALLKLDIEGGEYALMDGISDELLNRIDRIAIEPHPDLMGRPVEDLIQRLEPLFDVRWYGPLLQARRR